MYKGLTIAALALSLGACSQTVKVAQHDEYVQPKWYQSCKDIGTEYFTGGIKFWQTTQFYYSCGSSVSGFEEAANVKALQLARRNLGDRLNGKMNSRTTIEMNDTGPASNIVSSTQSQVLIVNRIKDTAMRHYSSTENYTYMLDGNYYSFVMIKLSRPDVDLMIAEYQREHNINAIDTRAINQAATQLN
ncbi:hypothetical protein OAP94_01555 [bacterium]|jgi:hypothetical protein|nr:hypothetical protein [bacterium]MDC1007347.1 hypothetical protein [bacterium]